MQTYHLIADKSEETELRFSSNGFLLAQNNFSFGVISVWETNTRSLAFQNRVQPGSKIALSRDGSKIAACGAGAGEVWDIRTGMRNFALDWGKLGREEPLQVEFDEDGELILVASNQALGFDSKTGALVRSARLEGELPVTFYGIYRVRELKVAIYAEQYPTENRRSLFVTDVVSGKNMTQIALAGADIPFVSPLGERAVIWRHEQGLAEIWSLYPDEKLGSIPLPALWFTLRFGPEDRFLAQCYDPARPTGMPRTGGAMEVWDLYTVTQLRQYKNILSWDLEWSSRTGIMAISNHFEYAEAPERNLTLFVDPFGGNTLGHTYGHRAHNELTYSFSPNGRWLASAFTRDYVSNGGIAIQAGTLAVTDLNPVLPPSRLHPGG